MSISTAQHGQQDVSIPPGTLVRFTRFAAAATISNVPDNTRWATWRYIEIGTVALVISHFGAGMTCNH